VEHRYDFGGRLYVVRVEAAGDGFAVTVGGKTYQAQASQLRPGEWVLELDGLRRCLAYIAIDGANHWVALAANAGSGAGQPSGQTYCLTVPDVRRAARHGAAAGDAALEAQMPGTVRQVLVVEGQQVARGQTLALLEAMKMEIRVTAPGAGLVTRVAVTAGQTVDRGQALFALGPLPDQSAPG
jgi:biotin carboxyl carrier protein